VVRERVNAENNKNKVSQSPGMAFDPMVIDADGGSVNDG
jgi:hypothetical protein